MPIDRWALRFGAGDASSPEEPPSRAMGNYFGIGIDASISLVFAALRRQSPGLFFSRTVNKLLYGTATRSGTRAAARRLPSRSLARSLARGRR